MLNQVVSRALTRPEGRRSALEGTVGQAYRIAQAASEVLSCALSDSSVATRVNGIRALADALRPLPLLSHPFAVYDSDFSQRFLDAKKFRLQATLKSHVSNVIDGLLDPRRELSQASAEALRVFHGPFPKRASHRLS